MADYNLGTAHGRIVIEYEGTASKQAEQDFQRIATRAAWLHGRLRSVGQGIRDFATDGGESFNRFGRSVIAFAGIASALQGVISGITGVGSALGGLGGGIGALFALMDGMDGLPESAQGFPRVIRNIILLSAGLTAFRAGTGILAALAGRFALLAPFAPIIRGLGNALFQLGLPIRAIAGVALAIAGLITSVKFATTLAKGVLALGAAFGALGGVVSIINGIIGAVTQLVGAIGLVPGAIAAAVAGAATLATGVSGISKALKFVAPAAGGAGGAMDQMAKAAKNAARSIAAAQRGVEDALRDQARTVRDTARQVANAQRALQDAVVEAAKAQISAARRVRDAQRDLGDATAAAARSAEDNARRLADAQKNVARTAEDSARAVANASRNLQSAIKSETSAQKGLNDARRTALEQLAELQERVSDLALDQEGASIALIEAQQNLERVNSDALSTELDRRKAQYELAVAQERVNDVTREATKAQSESADAIEKGVDGAQIVIDAQDRLKESQQALTDAQDDYGRAVRDAYEANAEAAQGLADAVRAAAEDRIASERRVADAQESLADAQQSQAETAAESARSVADAQEALALAQESALEAQEDAARRVEDAYRQLAEAQEDAAESMKSAAAAAAGAEDPINKLSPAAQALVRTLRGLKDEWDAVRNSVQEALFAGIAEEVQALAEIYLPRLEAGMVGVAKQFNLAAKEMSLFLQGGQTQADFNRGFQLTEQIVANLTAAVQPLLRAFRDIGIVGLEVFASLTNGVGSAAERFANFIAIARETGELRNWINRGVQGFRDLWQIIRDVSVSIDLIFEGLAGNDGSDFLASLAQGAANMRAFLESAQGQEALRTLGAFLQNMAERTMAVLKVAFEELGPVVKAVQPFFEDLGEVFSDVIIGALQIVGPLLKGVADILSFLSPVLSPILGFLFSLGLAWRGLIIAIQVLIPVISGLVTVFNIVRFAWQLLSAAFLANPWVLLIAAVIALVALIIYNWDAIVEFLGWVWGKILEGVQWFADLFQQYVIDPIVWIHDKYLEILTAIVSFVGDLLWDMTEPWRVAFEFVSGLVNDGLLFIQGLWENFMGWLFDSTTGELRSVTDIWNDHVEWVTGIVDGFLNWLLGFFGTNLEDLRAGVGRAIDGIGQFFRDLPGNIWNALIGLPRMLADVAVNAVYGLWNGFVAQGRWLWNNIMNWARTYIPGPILDFLGIASPSKYFRDQIGKMIPLGLMDGIDSMASRVRQTAINMVDGAMGAAKTAAMANDLSSIVGTEMADQLANGTTIATAATLTRANAAAMQATPPVATDGTEGGAGVAPIGTLVLNVAGNLDPTNKLAWNQAMDNIRAGINDREKARK